MFPYQMEKPPWFSQYLMNFSHFLIHGSFENKDIIRIKKAASNKTPFDLVLINLSKKLKQKSNLRYLKLEIGLKGFKGIIFYMYETSPNRLHFDIFKHSIDRIHTLDNLYFENLDEKDRFDIDVVIIPFGKFESNNKLSLSLSCENYEITSSIFYWSSSHLYKNLRSIIKVSKYKELKQDARLNFTNHSYSIGQWFTANLKEHVETLVNIITSLDGREDTDLDAYEMKSLIKKTNDFLLRIPENSMLYEHLLKELQSLKEKVEFLSKKKITSSINDIIDYYSP
ncbi:MAG: hypothetical protein ACFFAS_17215 [Promethearchaeota archaeon]